MSSDRTLMSVVRTSLSLIGFGFTIFQFFHTLNKDFLTTHLPAGAPRRFGAALVALGIVLLVNGMWYHHREVSALRRRRKALHDQGLIRHPEIHSTSSAVLIAFLLLLVGSMAMFSILTRSGPF